MKKTIQFVLTLCSMVIFLLACDSEKTKVFINSSVNNQESEITLTYRGDTVNKMQIVSQITDLGDDIDTAFKSIKKTVDSVYKDIQGMTSTVEKKDGKVIITQIIDFTNFNYEKDKYTLGFKAGSLEEERKLSNLESQLIANGATEKK